METESKLNPDYNHRSLNRKDLMSLDVIKNEDSRIRKFKCIDSSRDWTMNLYNRDIDGNLILFNFSGSVPKQFGVYNQKVDFINKNDDIERTFPKQLHIKLNKPEYNLSNTDINGSSPQCVKFKTARPASNPLEPKYKLCYVEELTPIEPKFIRDAIKIDDIQGAHPRKYLKWDIRSGMFTNDVPGSSVRVPKTRKTKFDNIDYSDVTNDVFKTKRCVDPLDPVYEVKYKNK